MEDIHTVSINNLLEDKVLFIDLLTEEKLKFFNGTLTTCEDDAPIVHRENCQGKKYLFWPSKSALPNSV